MKIFTIPLALSLSSVMAVIPTEKNDGLYELEVSALYWQTKIWGLEFAGKSLSQLYTGPNKVSFVQKVVVPDFAFRPGFKVEFGRGVSYDGLSLAARWTSLNSNTTNLKKYIHKNIVPLGNGVIPLWYEPLGAPASPDLPLHFWKSQNNWKLNFNTFDLELSRVFLPLSSMLVKVFMGVKGSYIQQQEHVKYWDGPEFYVPGVVYEQSKVVLHSNAAGAGPRAGFDSKWRIGAGFSIIADSAFSVLYSSVGMGTKYQNEFSDPSYNTSSHMREKEQELVPVLEGKLGFDWGRWFGSSSSLYFGMTVAYEVQYWWSQNHFRRHYPYNAPGNMWDMRGDLQLRGLTVSLRSEF
jgi:hypothetical protein